MTKIKEIYKCNICGNIVMVMHAGVGELVCCGQAMQLMKENTVDAAQEKHVPVLEKTPKGVKVKVGSVAHPMTEEHHIEWIEASDGERSCLKFLKPGEAAEAEFCLSDKAKAREYCNLHGLWSSE